MKKKGGIIGKDIWLDVLSFSVCLCLAYFLKWKTTDLVWSLWLGSLVIGYLTILCNIGASLYASFLVTKESSSPKSLALGAGIMNALFLLLFFSFHFGMFHFVHSVFLNQFFPLSGNSPMDDGLVHTMSHNVKVLFSKYSLFLIPALISQRRDVAVAWLKVRELHKNNRLQSENPFDKKAAGGGFMATPYKNVIRMHLLIFFFAGVHALKIENFFVYAIVYTVYFFPWKVIKKEFGKG